MCLGLADIKISSLKPDFHWPHYFLSFFWAAFFLTICNRFMALSCDSCEVGPLGHAERELLNSEVLLLVVLPLGPDVPLFPFPLSWLVFPGTKLLGLGRPTLLTLSQLTERLRPVLPKVRGGGGFNGTAGAVLLLAPILEPIPPLDDVARPVKPTGFWLVDEVAGFPLLFWVAELNFAVDGAAEEVLAAKAAHPVRPLVTEEETLVLEEFPEIAVDVLTSVLLNARKVVSCLSLVSGFLTNGSLTAGATETTVGAGFCGGF